MLCNPERVLLFSLGSFPHFTANLKKLASSWFWTVLGAVTTVLKNYLQKTDLPEAQGAWRENKQENQNSNNETTNNYREFTVCQALCALRVSSFHLPKLPKPYVLSSLPFLTEWNWSSMRLSGLTQGIHPTAELGQSGHLTTGAELLVVTQTCLPSFATN